MGCHHTTRIPRYGRDLAYLKPQAHVVVAAEGKEVFRLDLEGGRFLKPFELGGYDDGGGGGKGEVRSVECVGVADGSHGLLAFGTDVGTTEFWDPRSRNRVGVLAPPPSTNSPAYYYNGDDDALPALTAVEFSAGGLTLATGNSAGMVTLYDIRSPNPLLSKDQGYGFPIKALKFLHSSSGVRGAYESTSTPKVLSSDKRIIKIWDQESGKPWTSIEPSVDINDVCLVPDSGMIFTANEGREMHSFLIPALGPSPWWCAHLDTQIEQLADKHMNDPDAYVSANGGGSNEMVTYDNYKFLTKAELRNLNLDHLIGGAAAAAAAVASKDGTGSKKPTAGNLVRPYMHGYFVDQRLYDEARLIADPFEWERERKRIVSEKIDKQRESRIRTSGKVAASVKINKRLAERLVSLEDRLARAKKREEEEEREGGEKEEKEEKEEAEARQPSGGILRDNRFNRLFQNPDFAVDETSLEFQQLNPSTKPTTATTTITTTKDELGSDSESSNSDDDDDGDEEEENRSKRPPQKKKLPEMRISTSTYKKSGHDRPSSSTSHSRRPNREKSFGDRALLASSPHSSRVRKGTRNGGRGVTGEKQVTFFPTAAGKARKDTGGRGGEGSRGRPAKERRSASGNVFRREGLGK